MMIRTDEELRRTFVRSGLANIAYHSWASQARRERRFNVARVFEALAYARIARAEHAFRAMGELSCTTANVDRALQGLEPEAIETGPVTGTSQFTRELLTRAQQALAEGRDLRANELGDLYVCGTCGEMREGLATHACPGCGTVAEAHRSFKAIDAMGTLGPHALMHCLERTEEGLRRLVEGIADDLLAARLNPAEPSLKELVGHLADVDAVFRERAWLILETDKPELPPGHPPRLDAATVYRDMPISAILEAFHASRKQTITLLRGLTSAAWHRPGHHELYGDINLLHQANWAVHHERGHLVDMAQLRHDMLAQAAAGQPIAELAEVIVADVHEGD